MNKVTQAWPQRPWVLSMLLAITGLLFYLCIDKNIFSIGQGSVKFSLAVFMVAGAVSLAFSLERASYRWATGFALVCGLLLALVAYTHELTVRDSIEYFHFWSGLLFIGIALPFFQTIHKYRKLALPYQDLHEYAWSNILCGFVSWAFVGLSYVLLFLLASLFKLVGIDLLNVLRKETWFVYTFIGAGFGAALGVLKENGRIIANIQKLVMSVLSILAPVLSVGLVVFLVALLFMGLQPLWDATRETTPILLSCAITAIILINTIIRHSKKEESIKLVMRFSAIGLCVCVLPLTVIAFISTQTRIEQYGLTPDRIWALLIVLVMLSYGVVYFWSLIKGYRNWTDNLRNNNTRMAVLVGFVALFLALPLVNFFQMSTNSQLARIHDGEVSDEKIDYAAFAFEFGEEGKEALKILQSNENERIANKATLSLSAKNKWRLRTELREAKSVLEAQNQVTVFPHDLPIPDALKKAISQQRGCNYERCLLIWEADSKEAILVLPAYCSRYDNKKIAFLSRRPKEYQHCPAKVVHLFKDKKSWVTASNYNHKRSNKAEREQDKAAIKAAISQGEIDIRMVERKQVFIGGKPVGQAY